MPGAKGVPQSRIGATLRSRRCTRGVFPFAERNRRRASQVRRTRPHHHHHRFLLSGSHITFRNQKHQQQTLFLFPFHFSRRFPQRFSLTPLLWIRIKFSFSFFFASYSRFPRIRPASLWILSKLPLRPLHEEVCPSWKTHGLRRARETRGNQWTMA